MSAGDEADGRSRTVRRNARLVGVGVALATVVVVGIVGAREPGTTGAPSKKSASPKPEAACDAEAPRLARPKTDYPGPEEVLDRGTDYRATLKTSCGDITIDLLEEAARQTVNNFLFLAREGFYDGLTFHRVEQNSVLQAGDPNGRNGQPPDGPGYTIPDELPDKARQYVYGVVGMANRGPNSGGSQFFIVVHENRPAGYQPFYSIFGIVDRASYEVLEKIEKVPTRGGNDPVEAVRPVVPVYIESIDIRTTGSAV